MKTYAIYLTTYMGNKMPMFYIGSSSVSRIKDGYHGTVVSKKYKEIWLSELKNNKHLFKTQIIKTYESRKEAIEAEFRVQKSLNVVKSPLYINMSNASVNGFFGMSQKGLQRSQETKDKLSKIHSGKTITEEHRAAISKKLKGRVSNRKGAKMSKEFCEAQSKMRKGKPNLKNRNRKPSDEAKQKMSDAGKGRKQSQDHVAKRTENRKKSYVIIHPCGKQETIRGLAQFCRDNDLKYSSVCDVIHGRTKSHKGFKAYSLEDFESLGSPFTIDDIN